MPKVSALKTVRPVPHVDEEAKLREWARNFLVQLFGYRQPTSLLEYETDLDSVLLLMHRNKE